MMTGVQQRKQAVNWRSVALPAEHGAWSLILEPLVLGLLLAFSLAGLSFALAMFAVFLIHQPLKITLKDHRKGRVTARTQLASRLTVVYGAIALIFALPVVPYLSLGFTGLLILMLAFAGVQLVYDFNNQSRHWLAETSGAIALAVSASCVLVLGGWELWSALVVWLIVALRGVTSIVFVRTFFRQQRGKPADVSLMYGLHLGAIVLMSVLALLDLIPYLVIIAFVMLLARAFLTMRSSEPVKAQIIGMREVALGIVMIVLVVAGYTLNM